MFVKSFIGNPILQPNPKNNWESVAAYNGCPIRHGDNYYLIYRALGNTNIEYQNVLLSTIGIAKSSDKTNFKNRSQFIVPQFNWEKFGCEDPRVTCIDGEYFIFYTAISDYPITGSGIKVALALSSDLNSITEKHLVTPFNAKAMVMFPEKINGNYAAMFTYGTELGGSTMAYASFSKKSDIWSPDYWQNWTQHLHYHNIDLSRLNTDRVEVGTPPLEINEGWLILYSHIQNYFTESKVFGIEAAILDRNDPTKVLYRTDEPLMIPQEDYELQGLVPNAMFPSGCLLENHLLYIYYGAADTNIALSVISLGDLLKLLKPVPKHQVKLDKYQNNPILKPNPYYSWQSKAVYNPTVFHHDNTFHLIYRAMSNDNTSVMGYATSTDGYNLDYVHPEPIYTPRLESESKKIPNGNSGCEDPRITLIGDKLYLVYTAYNGVNPPNIALSTISLSDFLARNWQNWTLPVLISEPGVDDKDGCLMPEKINGSYVFFHRPGSKGLCLDQVDDLEFNHGNYLKSEVCLSLNFNNWDNLKTGVAGVPIKTKRGWLVLYHALNKIDHYYRIGGLMLDLKDISKIIGKIENPILEPVHDYERNGQFSNAVFPCGQVVVNNRLFVYYGGADSFICVATAGMDSVLESVVYL
jgi:beta-1,2-mannobiose phosphorylase / 1,2-beta-oligomannan phosphorylase